jgi:threonyl-tRNA synthetase
VEVDKGDERHAKQIRNAEQARVPLMAVVGAEEMAQNTLAIRSRKGI